MIMTNQTNKPVPQIFQSEKNEDGENQHNSRNPQWTQQRQHRHPSAAGRCYHLNFDRLARLRLGDCPALLLATGTRLAGKRFDHFRAEFTDVIRSSHQTKTPTAMQRRDFGLDVCSVNRKLDADIHQLVGNSYPYEDRDYHGENDYQKYSSNSGQSKLFHQSYEWCEQKAEEHSQRKGNQDSSGEVQTGNCDHSGYEREELRHVGTGSALSQFITISNAAATRGMNLTIVGLPRPVIRSSLKNPPRRQARDNGA